MAQNEFIFADFFVSNGHKILVSGKFMFVCQSLLWVM